MQEADYGMTDTAFRMDGGANNSRWADDDKLLVRFFLHPSQDAARSVKEGRPCFKDTEFVQIMQPGNKESIVMRPATQTDKQRFHKHYRAFKDRNDSDLLEGTPLDQWPAISRAVVEELKYFNVLTVEQLAGMSDANAQGHMGINMLRDKAKTWLDLASDSGVQVERITAAEKESKELQRQLGEALKRIEALEDDLEAEEEE